MPVEQEARWTRLAHRDAPRFAFEASILGRPQAHERVEVGVRAEPRERFLSAAAIRPCHPSER